MIEDQGNIQYCYILLIIPVDWSGDGDWSWLLETMATHVVECIDDELKDTRLTLQDALSLRLFSQQECTSQSAVIKGKAHYSKAVIKIR